ncbi:MAG: GNAT family N-acetyltransferase [Anaerolineales bacterium]|nr:GNAT family N-acetyltransferase [Anaerolineales bacterium]
MSVTLRPYTRAADFDAISAFLTRHYQPDNRDGNWFQPIWEYAYTHPWFDEAALGRIGIWEDEGEVVVVATYESRLGEVFFHTHPHYAYLKPQMLAYAEERLAAEQADGARLLKAYVNDFDAPFERVMQERGYWLEPDFHRPLSQFVIPSPFPPIPLSAGFRLQSLADENDLRKVHRVLHRGFNHPGEPPEEGLEGRRRMQSGPHFRRDLTIVVVAPSGDYVAFCGMWLDAVNRFGYVEPVATDPAYRRRGLGSAAVLEGIRRCGAEGATVAYVGSEQPFYRSLGFRRLYTQRCWMRDFPPDACGSY